MTGNFSTENLDLGLNLSGGGDLENPVSGFYGYCFGMSLKSLLKKMDGKTVVDVGSGYGLLAKECSAKNINTIVISINPQLGYPKVREKEKSATNILFGTKYDSDEVQHAHDSTAISALAQALPIAKESVDIVFDCYGAFHYAKNLDQAIAAIKEELRILRVDGEAYIYKENSKS